MPPVMHPGPYPHGGHFVLSAFKSLAFLDSVCQHYYTVAVFLPDCPSMSWQAGFPFLWLSDIQGVRVCVRVCNTFIHACLGDTQGVSVAWLL